MSRRKQILITVCFVIAGVLLVAGVGSWFVLQSNWLEARVRERIIAEVERTTGGRVELGGFTYDWHTLTSEFTGFVVHGTEPPGAAPLLRVDSLRVTLKIVSLLERNVDIASLGVVHPQVNLRIGDDGRTNIPIPRVLDQRKSAAQVLLDLRVGHFDLTNGELKVNGTARTRIDFRAEQVAVAAKYISHRHVPASYEISMSSQAVHLGSKWVNPVPFRLETKASLERDRVVFQQMVLEKGTSNLHLTGMIEHLANPRFDFDSSVDAAANDLGEFTVFHDLHGGRLLASGKSHYDSAGGFSFNGTAGARQTSYLTRWFALKDVSMDSAVTATATGLKFTRVVASMHGGKFVGEASAKRYRDLEIDGNASGLTLSEVNAYLPMSPLPKPLAWSGIATGRVHIEATLDPRASNFALETQMHINPAAPAIPVSGDVGLVYHQRGNLLEFTDSRLDLPNSRVSFDGTPSGELRLNFDSDNLNEFKPLLALLPSAAQDRALPELISGGNAHFDGTVKNVLSPEIHGQVALSHFRLQGQDWDRLGARVSLTPTDPALESLGWESLDLRQGTAHLTGSGTVGLRNWSAGIDSRLQLDAQFEGIDIVKTVAKFSTVSLPIIGGVASGSVHASGSLGHPQGTAHVSSDSLDAYGQRLNKVQCDLSLAGDELRVTGGRVSADAAVLSFFGTYQHVPDSWQRGIAHLKVDSNGFPLASLSPARKFAPKLNAEAQIHLAVAARVTPDRIEPLGADGGVEFRDVTIGAIPYGDLTITADTRQQLLHALITGNLRGTPLRGNARVQLAAANQLTGEVGFERIALATVYALAGYPAPAAVQGFTQGGLKFEGPLETPEHLRATLQLDKFEVTSQIKSDDARPAPPDLVFRNAAPIVVELSNGRAAVRSLQIAGKNTSLGISGSFASQSIDLKVEGSADLQTFSLLDPNVTSSGVSTVSASIAGTFRDPLVTGTLELKDGSFFLQDVPNGLSAVNGTVTFNRNRATLQKMTAKSGGGELSLGGFVSFGGGPLVYHLEGNAQNVRVRYAGSISVTANSSLRLSGTSTSSILSGTLTISRVVFNPNTDLGNLLASFGNAPASPTGENEFLTGLHFDVSVDSAPNLQVSTSLSRDVEAEIALRLRGTPSHPVLLGSLTANQGDIKVFGTRYSINRGEVHFVNAVKIEPVLDLDLETQTRGITVDITISGTFGKLNLNYRSDPPLQPRDIIALLTVGRAPNSTNASNVQAATDSSALQSGANTVLGQAIAPVSNRLSKLFGITNIKIDPLVQGITNTPQARLTLEQQISRDVTITYVTNLSQTSEQIFRLEWALNRQFSLVALRDDNGEFGIDFQYKKRFK